ncbi:MAG TPA: glycoside hydrolase family 20 zincin-like fold domain-containing protein, partial [Acidimicrobiales bacterium]
MNLLPRPRHLALGDELVACRPPATRVDSSLPAQGYELRIDAEAVHLDAGDDAGVFYGDATLDQLAHLHGGHLPVGTIRDWPDFPVRGVMLDISRDKVPTMETLETLVDRLASWKVNQVQLYFEHTFAYRDHEEVWRRASPLSAEEVRQLDAFCRARHVELVPNQNCLGHMGRWLAHERYRPLAIAPDGWPD